MRRVVLCAITGLCFSIVALAQNPNLKTDTQSPILWTYSGQVVNTASTPPTSRQFGNLFGIAQAAPGDVITFETEATTTATRQSGPLRIVERNGTTRIFAASGTSPDAPKELLVVATLHQLVVVDTTSGTFSATNFNTIQQSNPFGTSKTPIVTIGQRIKSSLTGHMNTPNETPSGWVGGFAEAVR